MRAMMSLGDAPHRPLPMQSATDPVRRVEGDGKIDALGMTEGVSFTTSGMRG
jgi:hypothetical protein